MPNDAPALTQRQCADALGVSLRRFAQILRDGNGPAQQSSGGVAPDEFGRWFRQRIMADLGVANDGQAYDFEAERARLTKAQADKTELEVAELRGELVRASDATAVWAEMIGACRGKLLALPAKGATLAIAAESLQAAEAALRAIVHEALAELHERTTNGPGADGAGEGGGGLEAAAAPDAVGVGEREPAPVRRRQRRARPVQH